ncbi:WD40 repeat domain-containing protein [Streptomyces sp. AN091965]|uniref:WD40 repeat domain-containing protein n=1 Tax=Streptomyces sp. AN091965 TaxID=2927803 RepID=UPI001F60CD47|nr:WD40 repeat domain-containing protein [Streptomyces sp. AN091965]MCI3935511.1 DNA-binding protein [Streptomyces sp. AN091965]
MTGPDKPALGGERTVLRALASRRARIYQAGRDLHIAERDLHLHYEDGVRRARQSTSDTRGGECPYPGLAAFAERQAGWFFGRDRLTAELLVRLDERVRAGGALAVVAPSGAGKSSLLQAGLLPALARGALPGSAGWPRLRLTPTARPLGALAAQLARASGVSPEAAAEAVADGPRACVALACGTAPPAAVREGQDGADGGADDEDRGPGTGRVRLVVVVDQLEELFTECGSPQDRQAFLDVLKGLAQADSDGTGPAGLVVLGLRSDFYTPCASDPWLRSVLQSGQLVVAPMTEPELRQAIVLPSREAGLDVEPGLAEILLRDLGMAAPALAGPAARAVDPGPAALPEGHSPVPPAVARYETGRLPLLAHALRATWQQRHGHLLTVEGYRATGGIDRAVATAADRALATLDESGQATARQLLLRLVHIGDGTEDTRRRTHRDRLLAELPDPELAARVLAVFSADDARLVTVSQDGVEITHEALLRAWPRLRSWIDTDRAGLLVHQQLTQTAYTWKSDGHDPACLYTGSRLALARDWAQRDEHRAGLGPLARDFLDASVQQHTAELRAARRRALRRTQLTVLLVVLLAMTLIGGGLAFQQWQEARGQRRDAAARNLLFQAESLRNEQAGDSLLLGIAAARTATGPRTRASLVKTLMGTHYRGTLPPHHGGVTGVAYNPRQHDVMATSADRTAQLWNIADPARPHHLATLTGHSAGVNALAFSRDGALLALGSWDGTASLWDVTDPERPRLLTVLRGHSEPVFAVAFSPDSRTLAVGSWDKTVSLWDVTDRASPRRLILLPHRDTVSAVAFSTDGHTLATGGESRQTTLWDVRRPARTRRSATLTGHTSTVWAVAFNPDGHILATAGADRTVILWDVRAPGHPRELGTLAGHGNSVRAVAFSPDGHTVATGSWDSTAALWDVTDAAHPVRLDVLTGHSRAVEAVAFRPDGQSLATGGADRSVIQWDAVAAAPPRRLASLPGPAGAGRGVALSSDGRTAVTTDGSAGSRATLWDLTDRARPRRLASLAGHTAGVGSVVMSRDGRTVLTGSTDDTAILWDIHHRRRPRQLASLRGHTNDVYAVALSPDGHTALTGSTDSTALLWDLSDPLHPRQLATLSAHGNWVNGVAFSPDGHLAVTAGGDGRAILWDVTRPARPRRLGAAAHPSGALYQAVFSPDGRKLATAGDNSTAVLWDIADPGRVRRLATLRAHASSVFTVAFSPDGRVLATGSWDKTTSLWDISNPAAPEQLTVLTGQSKGIGALAWSRGRHLLAAASHDGSTLVWDVTELTDVVADPVRRACAITDRGLSREEWTVRAKGLPYRRTCG